METKKLIKALLMIAESLAILEGDYRENFFGRIVRYKFRHLSDSLLAYALGGASNLREVTNNTRELRDYFELNFSNREVSVDALMFYKNILNLEFLLSSVNKKRNKPLSSGKSDLDKLENKNEHNPAPIFEDVNKDDVKATYQEVLDFIKEGDGEVFNSDIFNRFSSKSTRTIKRYLSELVELGLVIRKSEGKSVTYSVSDNS